MNRQTQIDFTRQMSPISITNYVEIVEPTLSKREMEVLDVFKTIAPCTCYDVSRKMGVGINVISGRFTGLRKKGKIKEVDVVKVGRSTHGVYDINK